ncbi:N-acetylglucosamine-6-phosphate deacetylase [Geotoga petraea]|uniref:N-acetylglucosamine 6-phosphate deacetylase n=1 Tax=Geotoga petraea TaxID=28234 RepID=A0A1G6NRC8_9BACT|nr:N-acetylglucosamine-6-phosphate deacetylase [Geotoga petraea]SDC69876.1 N-acetylglucosamine 6-phosphate deacetylase [Geotoga petraea]
MIIKNGLIVDPIDGEYTGNIEIKNEKIIKIEKTNSKNYEHIIMPGFVDVHTHALKKIDTMKASNYEFKKWAEMNFQYGVTSFLPTTVSASTDQIKKVLEKMGESVLSIEGIHLEGPFINPDKKGAQNGNYIRNPSLEELKEITPEKVKIMTMAPERKNFFKSLEYLNEKNIKVSIGHSTANYELLKKSFDKGAKRITHYPNALSTLHHRELGGTGTALYLDFNIELISDGVHCTPEFVDLTYKIKGPEKIILITDSMEAAGLEDGKYDLGGLDVFVESGVARLKSGNIAGSTLLFDQGVRNFQKYTKCSLKELAKVSSYNALKDLDIENKGRIKENYIANIVILDKNINIQQTIFKGKIVYQNK